MDRKVIVYFKRALPLLMLFALLAMPFILLLLQWLFGSGKLVLFSSISGDTLLLIGKSLLMAFSASVLATFTGTLFGFLLYKFSFALTRFYKMVLLLPLLVSPYIFAVAWKDGLFWLFGNSAALYSEAGVILVHAFVFFPLAMLITGSSISQINTSSEEAGLMIVSFRKMIIKIMFPMIRPAFTLSLILILIFSLSDFSVPAFFGVRTFTTEIFTQFSALYNFPLAIGQSIILLLICLILLLSESRYLSDAPFFSVSLKGSAVKKYNVGKHKGVVHILIWLCLVTILLLPVFILVVQSLTGRELFFGQAWELMRPAAIQSVKLSAIGAILITITGLWAGNIKERTAYKTPNSLLLFVFIVPSTVLGIALIRFYNFPAFNFIYSTSAILLIAWLGKFGFIASRIIGNGVKQIPASFEEAASVLGISSRKTFLKINLPLLVPSLFAAFVLSFILCLGELGATMMVYPPGMELMPVKTFTISANAPQALTSSMTLINLGVTILLIMLFFIFGEKVFKKYRYA